MTAAPSREPAFVLSNVPAGPGQLRLACAIILTSAVIFALLVPFAKMPLGNLPAFIPLYQSALFINNLITAVFLLGQSRFLRSETLVLLAGGYLFTAFMSVVHILTFPGLFSPTGLLGAGTQSTAWLYVLWHAGFPCFVIAYAVGRPAEKPLGRGGIAVGGFAASIFAAV